MSGAAHPVSPGEQVAERTPAEVVRAAVVSLWPVLVAVVAVLVAVWWGGAAGEIRERTMITMLINLVIVVGVYVFVGNSGIFSFGHLSFMAVGAYVTGLLTIPAVTKKLLLSGLPGWLVDVHASAGVAIVAGALAAALFAAIICIPLMRLSGISASLATFAVLIALYVVLSNWRSVTGGTSGMTGVPTTTSLADCLIWSVVAIVVAFAFQRSRTGLRLRATREDEVAAQALGIGVFNERRAAFVLSAFLVGIGGGLFAEFNGSFTPDAFYLSLTFLIIAMLVVGGMNSLTGAVLGVFVLTAVSELLRTLEEGSSVGPISIGEHPGLREVGLALVMLAILIFRPSGLTGGREVRPPRRLRGGFPTSRSQT